MCDSMSSQQLSYDMEVVETLDQKSWSFLDWNFGH